MKINPEIEKILGRYHVPKELGLTYLLMLYHGIGDRADEIVPEEVYKQVNLTKIVERDYDNTGLKWNVELYEAEVGEDTAWIWLAAYRKLFGDIRADAIGTKADVEKKMKKYFSEHPEVRVGDIMEAANLYLDNFRSGRQGVKFLQGADYFINKLIRGEGGVTLQSRLDMYLEVIKKRKVEEQPAANLQMQQVVK